MKKEEFKPIAKKFLEHLGFKVVDIEPNVVLTPDFEAIGKTDKYTMELKSKGDNPEEVSRDLRALSQGEVVSKSIPMGPRNRMGGIIREGVLQMLEYDPRGESFRIIWLHSAGQDPYLHNERFHSTLFGSETLISFRLKHTATCYYFHESAFYSWRNYLDGAILTYNDKAQLCINSLSPRVEQFRKSELAVSMSNGICDPGKLEKSSDNVMIADCDIDRRRHNKVINYLKEKYGFDHLRNITMKRCMISFPMEILDIGKYKGTLTSEKRD
jgi:hypothetical protein